MINKHDIEVILNSFETRLNDVLPHWLEVARKVDKRAEYFKRENQNRPRNDKHSDSIPENAFLNMYVMPQLYSVIAESGLVPVERLPDPIRGESYKHYPELMGVKCARGVRHPFSKIICESSPDFKHSWEHIYARWKGELTAKPTLSAWPDFALGSPFRTIFEGKFFRNGQKAGEKELVLGLYETFYYLSLPYAEQIGDYPQWDYEYGCFIAFDASKEGYMKAAWNSMHDSVKRSFWEDANIKVIILRT